MPDIKNKIQKDETLIQSIKNILIIYPNVELPLVLAIIETESSFNPSAYRYEAHIKDASYGLMQVLYSTAKWLGFQGKPEELFDVKINLLYGIKYLSWLFNQNISLEGVIMSYNEGLGNYKKGKRVYSYYTKVFIRYESWKLIL